MAEEWIETQQALTAALFDEPARERAALRRALLGAGGRFRFRRRRRRTITRGQRTRPVGGARCARPGASQASCTRKPLILEDWTNARRGFRHAIFGESGESLPVQGREVLLVVSQSKRAVNLI